jgi:hypothetical protein
MGWICKSFDCKSLTELYDILVSSEKEEHVGR